MEQQSFDKVVKDSLSGLKVGYNAEHWQQMESLLNNLPIGDQTDIDAHFDASIKDKISDLHVPMVATAWADIEAALTQGELADGQFDEVVNDKIGQLESSTVNNWENIEQALDAEEVLDAAFDTEIYTKLKQIQPNYQPSHWQRLVAKLNTNLANREKLYRHKLMEVILMVLLLLNFYQYLPTSYPPANNENQYPEEIFKAHPELEVVPNPTAIQEKAPKIVAQQEKTATNEVNKPLIVDNSAATKVIDKSKTIAINTTSESVTDATSAIHRNYSILNKLSVIDPNIGQKTGLSISVSEMNHHLTLHTETGNSLINTVPSLTPNFVESQYITPLGCQDCKSTKIPARLRMGIVANFAINNAYRTGGEILDISALNQKGFGYGSGFSLGFKYGRWEIETGLSYAAKRYDPNIINAPNVEVKRIHFQTIHLQTLHIPANLRFNYAVLGKGRWHLYAQTGAALNVILRAEYDLAEVAAGSRSSANEITTSRLGEIDYNNGLFAGDGFKTNRYLSISMGAGIERYISPRWSLFVQPDFHFHFSGNRIGPTQDRINTLSLSFGARKSL